jgi:hypothetical protein
MKIKLDANGLNVDGSRCSSITIYEREDGKCNVTMFDNPKYMRTKIKKDKWFGNIKVVVGKRHSMTVSKVEFEGMKPRKVIGQERSYYHRINKKGDYINLYKYPSLYSGDPLEADSEVIAQ